MTARAAERGRTMMPVHPQADLCSLLNSNEQQERVALSENLLSRTHTHTRTHTLILLPESSL